MKIGIIGYGAFGRLLTELLAPHATVVVTSRRAIQKRTVPAGVNIGNYDDIAACNLIIIAVDLAGFTEVCQNLKGIVRPGTIVMDVCSVKVEPAHIMNTVLGDTCRLLATHPMFGPQSVERNGGTTGLKMVWHELAGGPFPEVEALFTQKLNLELLALTPDEHDSQMAWVHGLTFFIGRGLVNLDIPDLTLDTGYYRKLLDLHDLEQKHSLELFHTVERGNPYAKGVRARFIKVLSELEDRIEGRP